jgi:hypothetical protein
MKLKKCHYANATGGVHPLVVYLESDALSTLIRQKHTLRLKNTNHEDGTNIICSLSETHTVGRFDLQNEERTFKTDPDRHIKLIDIGFSNNGVMLPRGAAAGTNTTGSDDEVLAIGDDLLAFIDFAPARTLSSSFLPLDQPGDVVTYLYNRGNNSELIFSNSYGAGTQLAAIGQHRGVTRSGSWESVLDSWPVDLNDVNTEFTVHSLFKLTSLSFTYLWDVGYQKILIWGQQLAFEDANGAKNGVLSIIPHVDYLLTVARTNTNNGALTYRMERLDDNTVQTATSAAGLSAPPNANGFPWRLGHASTHFSHLQSCWILHNGTDAAHQTTCQQWIKNTYAGTTTAAQDGASQTTSDAQWFLELEIKE